MPAMPVSIPLETPAVAATSASKGDEGGTGTGRGRFPFPVANEEQLVTLAHFYSGLIQAGVVTHVPLELFFIARILALGEKNLASVALARQEPVLPRPSPESPPSIVRELLRSPHSCVAFALHTLEGLGDVLASLGAPLLAPLRDNAFVRLHTPLQATVEALLQDSVQAVARNAHVLDAYVLAQAERGSEGFVTLDVPDGEGSGSDGAHNRMQNLVDSLGFLWKTHAQRRMFDPSASGWMDLGPELGRIAPRAKGHDYPLMAKALCRLLLGAFDHDLGKAG